MVIKRSRAEITTRPASCHPPAADQEFADIEAIGVVAQLGERSVRNAEVEGSNPFNSTDHTPSPVLGNTVCVSRV